MITFLVLTFFVTLYAAAAFSGITGRGAADRRDPDWSLFPLSGRDGSSSPSRAA